MGLVGRIKGKRKREARKVTSFHIFYTTKTSFKILSQHNFHKIMKTHHIKK
jgi:hypothetical protein